VVVGSVVWLHSLLGLIPNSAPPHTHDTDLIKYAATPPNQPQRYILSDYFNNYNFNKALIIRSLMMVIEPKHVGALLM